MCRDSEGRALRMVGTTADITSFPYASAGIAEIYELTPGAVAQDAAPIESLTHPDDLEAWRASFAESAARFSPWHLEYRVQLPDQGLRHFADTLRRHLRAGDLAGCIGGEEFAVLLGAMGLDDARTVADRIQQRLEAEPLQGGSGAPVTLTVSIGITEMSAADTSAEAALSRSDFALYRAKKGGRNRVECA